MSGSSLRSPGGPTLAAVVERFAEYLALERRCSPHTVLAYRRDLSGLVAFLTARLEREPRLPDVSRMSLRAWLGELAQSLASTSIARKLSSVRPGVVCSPGASW